VALGSGAASFNQAGSSVAIGQNAGAANQGQYSIAIGLNAGQATQPAFNICLNASGAAVNPTTSGFYANPVRGGQSGTPLVYTAGGEIARATSSLRYKENIVDLQKDTSKIFQLQAKSFDLKSGAKNRLGYIAEEVYKVDPSLVILNSESQPEALEEFHIFVCLLEEVKRLKTELINEKDKSYANLISANTIEFQSIQPVKIIFTQLSISNHISYQGSKILFDKKGIFKISTHFYVENNTGFTAFCKNENIIEYSVKSIKNTQVYNETIIQIDDPEKDFIELVVYSENSFSNIISNLYVNINQL
jgi:hypothetical protein